MKRPRLPTLSDELKRLRREGFLINWAIRLGLVWIVVLIWLLTNPRFSLEHFDDGSGRITVVYCLAFTQCEEEEFTQ